MKLKVTTETIVVDRPKVLPGLKNFSGNADSLGSGNTNNGIVQTSYETGINGKLIKRDAKGRITKGSDVPKGSGRKAKEFGNLTPEQCRHQILNRVNYLNGKLTNAFAETAEDGLNFLQRLVITHPKEAAILIQKLVPDATTLFGIGQGSQQTDNNAQIVVTLNNVASTPQKLREENCDTRPALTVDV